MKVKVRDSINTTKQINLRDLTPVQKVTVAIQCAIDESKMMQNKRRRKEQASYQARLREEDTLKNVILTKAYQALILNTYNKKKKSTTDEVFIKVDGKYKYLLFDEIDQEGALVHTSILKHSDFAQYNVSIVPECQDIRRAFPEMPYLLKLTRKELGAKKEEVT